MITEDKRDFYGDLIPPEQTETYPGQAFFHKHNPNIKRAEEHADQPQAASAGALSAEQILNMVLEVSEDIDIELWGKEGSKEINARGRIMPLISAFANTLLAAHDQKVRAEVLEEADKRLCLLKRTSLGGFEVISLSAAVTAIRSLAEKK